MKNCITLIDKAVDANALDCWQTAKNFTHVLASEAFETFHLDGNYLKGERICYENVDCRSVGWAILHACEEYGQLDAIMPVQPHNWVQEDSNFYLIPCFKIAEDPTPKKDDKDQGYVQWLKDDPCGFLEYLLNCRISRGKPSKKSRSGFGRSYTYDPGDAEQLNRDIQVAANRCRACDPCNPCLDLVGSGRRSIAIKVC